MSDNKPGVKVCANDDGGVFIVFKEPTCAVSLTVEQAKQLAALLIKKAKLSLFFTKFKREEDLKRQGLLSKEPSIDHAAMIELNKKLRKLDPYYHNNTKGWEEE